MLQSKRFYIFYLGRQRDQQEEGMRAWKLISIFTLTYVYEGHNEMT